MSTLPDLELIPIPDNASDADALKLLRQNQRRLIEKWGELQTLLIDMQEKIAFLVGVVGRLG